MAAASRQLIDLDAEGLEGLGRHLAAHGHPEIPAREEEISLGAGQKLLARAVRREFRNIAKLG